MASETTELDMIAVIREAVRLEIGFRDKYENCWKNYCDAEKELTAARSRADRAEGELAELRESRDGWIDSHRRTEALLGRLNNQLLPHSRDGEKYSECLGRLLLELTAARSSAEKAEARVRELEQAITDECASRDRHVADLVDAEERAEKAEAERERDLAKAQAKRLLVLIKRSRKFVADYVIRTDPGDSLVNALDGQSTLAQIDAELKGAG